MGGIKDPNDPQILPKGAYRNALSIKGGIPFFEHCEHSAKARGIMLGKIKPYWIKVMASEQRINWLKGMVRKGLLVRDVDAFLKSQEEKLRSEEVKIREEERSVLLGLMTIKLRDEKKNYRRILREREDKRKWLKSECGSNNRKYLLIMRKLRKEIEVKRKELKEKYFNKTNHLYGIRKREEEKKNMNKEIPEEIREFESCKVFSEERMKEMIKMKVENMTIGKVELDEDEKAALSLHPNFAILKYLDEEENERDIELGLAKIRYEVRNREERKKVGNIEYEGFRNKKIKIEEDTNKETEEKNKIEDAKERQVYNPIEKTFDFSKRRVTDIKENSKVYLPKPVNAKIEGEMEMIRNILMKEFRTYKEEIDEKNKREREKNKELAKQIVNAWNKKFDDETDKEFEERMKEEEQDD